jgi:nucleoside-triphosphatase THEP1
MKTRSISIITGERQAGKTSRLLQFIAELKQKGKIVGGIVSEGTFKEGKRNAFYIKDIQSNDRILLMADKEMDSSSKIGKFYYLQSAFDWGINVIQKAISDDTNYLVLDEIGKLEMEGKAWYPAIQSILKTDKNIIFVVRKDLVEAFKEKFNIRTSKIILVD